MRYSTLPDANPSTTGPLNWFEKHRILIDLPNFDRIRVLASRVVAVCLVELVGLDVRKSC